MSLVHEVVFSSDGSGAISVWEPKGGTLLMSYKGASVLNPHSLCLLGNDYVLGVEKGKPMIQAWPVNSQEKAQFRMICPGRISAMQASPDNCYIAVSIETKLHIWQISSGRLLTTASSHYQPITVVKWSQDANFIVTGSEDGSVCVWQLSRLICKQTIAFGIPGTTTSKGITGVAEPLHVKSQHTLPVTDIFLSRFGMRSRVATVSHDRTCKIFDLSSGEELLSLIFDVRLTCVTFDYAESNVLMGTPDGVIKSYCLSQVPRTRDHHVQDTTGKHDFVGHEKSVTALSCSVTGITLVSASVDETIKLWHMFSKQCLRSIQHKGPVLNAFLTLLPPQLHEYDFNPKILLKSFDKSIDSSDLEIEIYTAEHLSASLTSSMNISHSKFFSTSGQQPSPSFIPSSGAASIMTSSQAGPNRPTSIGSDAMECSRREIDRLKEINKTLYEFCMNNVINRESFLLKKKKRNIKESKETNGTPNGQGSAQQEREKKKQSVSNLGFKGKKKVRRNRNKLKKLNFDKALMNRRSLDLS